MRRGDGRLLHTWRSGQAKFDAYLDDYACFINALVSSVRGRLRRAVHRRGGRAGRPDAGPLCRPRPRRLLLHGRRPRAAHRAAKGPPGYATPSGNSMAATALVRLGKLTGRTDFIDAAVGSMRAAVGLMQRYPTARGSDADGARLAVGPTYEIAILGDTMERRNRRSTNSPGDTCPKLVAFQGRQASAANQSPALERAAFANKNVAAQPTVYICENFALPGRPLPESMKC